MRSFKVVRSKRLYEQIAEQIEALIKAENLQPGSKLPGERELAEMFSKAFPKKTLEILPHEKGSAVIC